MVFKKTVEDFECENCGQETKGSGFTNHCPECLWSKHMDVDPGDRESFCEGMMRPVSCKKEGETYRILHRCQDCRFERWSTATSEDNFEAIIALS